MRLPPRWVRRPLALLVLSGLAFAVTLLPFLAVLALGASALLPGRWRVPRLLTFALVYLLLEVVGLLAALGLWVASGFGWKLRSPAFQRAHYAVLRGLLAEVLLTAQVLFHLRLDTDEVSWSPLDDGVPGSTNAMVVLSRHAGPGDSLLLVRTLMDRDHLRRPRIVLKAALQLDPLLDVYLNRLPNAFLDARGDGLAEQVGELARGLGEEDALLIFPEGGNFTPQRRRRVIDRLRGKGLDEQAARAEALEHLLPPRPGGVAAALAAAPHADVVLVAHSGLEHLTTAADLWHGLPMDSTVGLRWQFFPAAQVPRERDALEPWLYERWADMDRWVDQRLDDRPGRQPDERRRVR